MEKASREDLIKFVKKQAADLKKCKAENEELNKQLSLASAPTNGSISGDVATSNDSSEADEWKREKEELLVAYQASQQSLEKCASQIAELEEHLSVMTMARDDAVKQLCIVGQHQCEKCERFQTQLSDLGTTHEQLKQSLFEERSSLEAERNQLKLDLNNARVELSHVTAELQRTGEELHQLKLELEKSLLQQNDTSVYELSQANEELKCLKQEIEALTKDYSDTRAKHELSESGRKDLEIKLDVFVTEQNRLKTELSTLETERDQLKSLLESSQAEYRRVNFELDAAESSLDQFKAELVQSQSDHDQRTNDLEKINIEFQKLRLELESSHSERDQLKLDLDNATDNINQLNIDLEKADSINQLKLEQLKSQEESQTRTNETAQEELRNDTGIAELRSKLVEWETMMQLLKAGKDDADRELQIATNREKRVAEKLDELLAVLETTFRGVDLFHDNSHSWTNKKPEAEDSFGVLSKFSLLTSFIDHLCFERDEWKAKLQHTTEQLTEARRALEEQGRNEEEMNKLRAIIETMTDKLMEREESYEQSLSDRKRLSCELAALKTQMAERSAECEELKKLLEQSLDTTYLEAPVTTKSRSCDMAEIVTATESPDSHDGAYDTHLDIAASDEISSNQSDVVKETIVMRGERSMLTLCSEEERVVLMNEIKELKEKLAVLVSQEEENSGQQNAIMEIVSRDGGNGATTNTREQALEGQIKELEAAGEKSRSDMMSATKEQLLHRIHELEAVKSEPEKELLLEAENRELSERANVAKLQCLALEQRIDNLVENIVQKSGDVDRLTVTNEMLEVELERVASNLSHMNTERDRLIVELSARSEQLESSKQRCSELESLHAQLFTAGNGCTEFGSENLQSAEEQLQVCKIDKASNDFDTTRLEMNSAEDVKGEQDSLHMQLAESVASCDRLTKDRWFVCEKLADTSAKCKSLEKQLKLVREELDSVRSQHSSGGDNCSELDLFKEKFKESVANCEALTKELWFTREKLADTIASRKSLAKQLELASMELSPPVRALNVENCSNEISIKDSCQTMDSDNSNDLNSLHMELQEAVTKCEKLTKELWFAREKLADTTANRNSLEKQLASTCREINTVGSQANKDKGDNSELSSLQKEFEDSVANCEVLTRDLWLAREKLADTTVNRDSLTKQLDTVRKELETIRSQSQESGDSNSEILNTLQKQLLESVCNCERLTKELWFAREELADAVANRKSLICQLESVRSELREAIVYKSQQENIREQLVNSFKDRDELKGEVESLHAKLEAKSVELDSINATCRINVTDMEKRVHALETLVKEKEAEIEAGESRLRRFEEANSTGEGEVEQLRKQMSEDKERMTIALSTAKDELAEVRGALGSANDRLDKSSADLDKVTSELSKVTVQLKSKSVECDSMKKEITVNFEDIARMKVELLQKTEECENVNAQLATEKAQCENLALEIMKNGEECERMKAELVRKEEKIKEIKMELERKVVELETAKSEKEALKSELVGHENQLHEASSAKLINTSNLTETTVTVLQQPTTTATPQQQCNDLKAAEHHQQELTALRAQLQEREDREAKLRQVALKAKKEASEFKTKFEAAQRNLESSRSSAHSNDSDTAVRYHSLQTEYDKLEAIYDALKADHKMADVSAKQLADEFARVKLAMAELMEQKEAVDGKIAALEQVNRALDAEKREKEQELSAERIQRQYAARERSEMEAQVRAAEEERVREVRNAEEKRRVMEEEHIAEVRQINEQVKALKEQLELAKRDVTQTSMLDLEIAAYDRTVHGLNETLAERDGLVANLREELQRKTEHTASLQKMLDGANSQCTQAEEHASKLKQLLVKAKKDLSDAKRLEAEQGSSGAQMRGKLEMLSQLVEEQKLEIARLASSEHRLSERLTAERDTQQKTSRALEAKVRTMEGDLVIARSELVSVQQEYDAYKVRVHTVLKQQKNRSADELALEQERAERTRAESTAEQLRNKVQQLVDKMVVLGAEQEQLQEENERLNARYLKLQTDTEAREKNWRERLDRAAAETSALTSSRMESIEQLGAQSEALTHSFKQQIQRLQEEHQTMVDNLRHRIDENELEIDRLRSRLARAMSPQQQVLQLGAATEGVGGVSTEVGGGEVGLELRVEERQSGEGSEMVEESRFRAASVPSSTSLVPFEQLISVNIPASPADSMTPPVIGSKQYQSLTDDSTLKSLLSASEKQTEHLTELLNESEATVLHLTEQAQILKAEIRRMERNLERETSISNLEYLKNIVYKFVTLRAGTEKSQLIPVLTTMLRLSPEEREIMSAIASGGQDNIISASGGGSDSMGGGGVAGWSSYLQRWTNLT